MGWLLVRKRNDIRAQNLIAFFFLAYMIALLLFAVWFARWGGFPEFSEVGLLQGDRANASISELLGDQMTYTSALSEAL